MYKLLSNGLLALFLSASVLYAQQTKEPSTTDSVQAAPVEAASSDDAPAKPERKPLYHEDADARAEIAAAIQRAKLEHKSVMLQFGGNWCGWCYRLNDVLTTNDTLSEIIAMNYEVVHVDEGPNRELMASYGEKTLQHGFPFVTVLSAEGEVLVNQPTGELEEGSGYDLAKLQEFLEKHAPEKLNARSELKAALANAGAEGKRVLLHVGSPYCGWCKVLSKFLHERREVFQQDYVDLYIDTLRMEEGEAVAAELRPGESLGIPWMVILDPSGEVLADSIGSTGNIGYPVAPAEVDHFLSMLDKTRKRISDEDLATVRADLEAFREKREQSLQEARQQAATD